MLLMSYWLLVKQSTISLFSNHYTLFSFILAVAAFTTATATTTAAAAAVTKLWRLHSIIPVRLVTLLMLLLSWVSDSVLPSVIQGLRDVFSLLVILLSNTCTWTLFVWRFFVVWYFVWSLKK